MRIKGSNWWKAASTEAEPLFGEFIHALAVDALKHPERLHDVKEVWNQEWDELLKDVEVDED